MPVIIQDSSRASPHIRIVLKAPRLTSGKPFSSRCYRACPPSLGGGLYRATGEVGDPAQQAPAARQRVTELLWAASFPRGLWDSGPQGPGAPALIHTETCIEESVGPVTCPKTQGLKDVYSVWTLVSRLGFVSQTSSGGKAGLHSKVPKTVFILPQPSLIIRPGP